VVPVEDQRVPMLRGPSADQRGLWPLRRGCQDPLDEGALGLGVAGTVRTEPGGQGALEVAIGAGQSRGRHGGHRGRPNDGRAQECPIAQTYR
jgi:hypothetical protein